MAITRRSTLMVYAALIFCLPGTANARPSAEQVVANYILALGGSKAVASVKTIIVRGIYTISPGYSPLSTSPGYVGYFSWEWTIFEGMSLVFKPQVENLFANCG